MDEGGAKDPEAGFFLICNVHYFTTRTKKASTKHAMMINFQYFFYNKQNGNFVICLSECNAMQK